MPCLDPRDAEIPARLRRVEAMLCAVLRISEGEEPTPAFWAQRGVTPDDIEAWFYDHCKRD